MIKFELSILMVQDFTYKDNTKKGAIIWVQGSDPRPMKISVFGEADVAKAHAYEKSGKGFFSIQPNFDLQAQIVLI